LRTEKEYCRAGAETRVSKITFLTGWAQKSRSLTGFLTLNAN